LIFKSDKAAKQALVTKEIRKVVDEMGLYQKLEKLEADKDL